MLTPENKPKKSPLAILFRILLSLGVLGLLLAIIVPLGAYFYISKSLPHVDTLADYRPPIITRVYSDDGTVIAELFEERLALYSRHADFTIICVDPTHEQVCDSILDAVRENR